MTTPAQTDTKPVVPEINWFSAPAQIADFWLQMMQPPADLNEQIKKTPDLLTAPMAAGMDEAMKLADVFNALVQTQVECWANLQSGMTQWMQAVDLRQQHTKADSAGAILCPPEALTPENFVKTATGVVTVMTDAMMNAVKHDIDGVS
ncbi:MAG TPA: hypothetical protein VFM48_11180 [Aquabacterium sp.]|nr:hypothetical protein [Aquabacterium sp.]